MARFHIAQSGKKAGEMVHCPAKNFCTLRTADGQPVHHGNFVYDRDANNWNRIEKVIANGGNEALEDSKDAMNVLENAQSLSDSTVQAVLENESANQMGATVHVLPRKALEELAKARKAVAEQSRQESTISMEDALKQVDEVELPLYNVAHTTESKVLNGEFSPETLRVLAGSDDVEVLCGVAGNRSTPVDVLRSLGNERAYNIDCSLSGNSNTPSDVLARIASDYCRGNSPSESTVRHYLASNPSTPQNVLSTLAKNDRYLRRVAGNPNVPNEVQMAIAESDNTRGWGALAKNPSATSEALEALALNGYDDAISNHNISQESLDRLAHMQGEDYLDTRFEVAKQGNTRSDTLSYLAKDETPEIRVAVAGNHNVSPETLASLSSDDDERVRFVVAGNSMTPADSLNDMSWDSNSDVRSHLAGNTSIPRDAAIRLATDEDQSVRLNLATNKQVSSEALAMMGEDKDAEVLRGLLRNPNTPKQTYDKASGKVLAASKTVKEKEWLASTNRSIAVLSKLARSKRQSIQEALVSNPNTPSDIADGLRRQLGLSD